MCVQVPSSGGMGIFGCCCMDVCVFVPVLKCSMVGFYGISTIVGYLKSIPLYKYYI